MRPISSQSENYIVFWCTYRAYCVLCAPVGVNNKFPFMCCLTRTRLGWNSLPHVSYLSSAVMVYECWTPHIKLKYFRFLWPCIVGKVWREKTNKMQQFGCCGSVPCCVMLCCEECPATDVPCTFVAGHSSQHNITQHGMLQQHPTGTTKLICDYL